MLCYEAVQEGKIDAFHVFVLIAVTESTAVVWIFSLSFRIYVYVNINFMSISFVHPSKFPRLLLLTEQYISREI
jgi:hypothetical protein